MEEQSQGGVWVWYPAAEGQSTFEHPSDIPNDEKTAKARWLQNRRGPGLARISPATLLQTKPTTVLISEHGVTREVAKSMVLPWYEGLLLLDELEQTSGTNGHLQAAWRNDKLKQLLDAERAKFKLLSGALYSERRLLSTAVTGAKVSDKENKDWNYRRENVKADDKSGLAACESKNGYFSIKEVLAYLPPWEAFCSEKCGFYQDFYLVRWDHPYSEVDYSKAENGCPDTVGATWEPDECLPAHLDPLRVAAKAAWSKRRREEEQRAKVSTAASTTASTLPPQPSPSPSPSPKQGLKREREEEDEKADLKLSRFRRDGSPLARDAFRRGEGHDFAEPEDLENFTGIRKGWPKTPQDYPPGYHVANPPGFCWEGCDCMDDQRVQKAWETFKDWLEERPRTDQALMSIENFSQQTQMVRRRGQVSRMCFFETAQDKTYDLRHERAALDLAGSMGRRITEVLKAIPVGALMSNGEASQIMIPAVAFVKEDADVEPLRFEGRLMSGDQLPGWLRVDPSTGILSIVPDRVPADFPDLQLQVEMFHSEGISARAVCRIMPKMFGSVPPWIVATGNIMARFNSYETCPLDLDVRSVLSERLGDIYDHKMQSPREISLGQWLKCAAMLVRMLRSASVAHIVPGKGQAPSSRRN